MFSERVVSYAGGLPLALKVLGSFLYDKDKDEWVGVLDRLKDNPNMEIMGILKISYDGLEPLDKELFLDVACFYRGWKTDSAMEELDACGFHPRIGVKVLIQKALITISKDGEFDMHDLVQEMGHYIVRGKHPNNPERHSRLWQQKEIEDICSKGTITENDKIEAIRYFGYSLNFPKIVSKMKKLRLLHVIGKTNVDYRDGPNFLSDELRYICWRNFPASPFPESFHPSKLVVLTLVNSLQEELWKGKKHLPCLKELKLKGMKRLVRTPDFGGLPCLQKLTLEQCNNLIEIHSSLGNHTSLIYISLFMCDKLKTFPTIVHLEKVKTLIIKFSNSWLSEFPEIKANMDSLINLELNFVEIEILPTCVGEYCANLISLDLSHCTNLKSIDFSLSQFTQLKFLTLSYCENLVELPDLPSSLSILEALCCYSLEVVADCYRNCEWLCQVSLLSGARVIGSYKLLQTMLQGKAIENHHAMSLKLKDYTHEIAKRFRPRLRVGSRYRWQFPLNWYKFSGFLICVVFTGSFDRLNITMTHVHGLRTQDYQHDLFVGQDKNDEGEDDEKTWVGYVPFDSLRRTTWWNQINNTVEFYIDPTISPFMEETQPHVSGFGVTLIPKKNQIQTATNSFSKSSNDYTCEFGITRYSKSILVCSFFKVW